MVEFRILGPLQARAGDRALNLGGPLAQRILAALLLEPNRVVGLARLIEAAWGDDPPATARRQVQNRIAELRTVLDAGGAAGAIGTRDSGYLLRLDPGQLDALVFDERVRAASADTDPAVAVRHLRAALALWRGPALAGLATAGPLRLAAAGLEEKRLAAVERCLDGELALGRHHEVVPELRALVAEHPLRERLVGRLMTALYDGGRRDEALSAYRELADRLAAELGLDPGPELRARHDAIAGAGAAAVGSDPSTVRPAQLPADVSAFTGRAGYLSQLDGLLAERPPGGAVVISAISGSGGVGKTALAVHWGRRVRDRFPDGQLYVNLRGYATAAPLRPLDVLDAFLHALGVAPDQVPSTVDDAAAMYRRLLTGRRVLVVLDNAAGAGQVRPLLAGGAGCLTLVTSRDALTDLVVRDGAQRLRLDVLPPDEAVALLTRILGADRVAAEPDAVAELAHLCAGLPLALRIAAAHLTGHPRQRIAAYTGALRTGNRLAALEVEGDEQAAVRAVFDLSYDALPAEAQRLFRLLGLVPGPDVTPDAAAALAGTGRRHAHRILTGLAAAHMTQQHPGHRYAFHDLLRLYAAERARGSDPGPERRAAVARLYDHYLYRADAAARLLFPAKARLPVPPAGAPGAMAPGHVFDDDDTALAWFDAERPNLVAAVEDGARNGPRRTAWLVADALRGYFGLRGHVADWLTVAQAALAAAQAEEDPQAQAAAHLNVADVRRTQSRYADALEHFQRAAEFSAATGWLLGQGTAVGNAGTVHWALGELATAAEQFSEAVAICRRTGDTAIEAVHLGNLSSVYQDLGRLADAADCQREAMVLHRKANSRDAEAIGMTSLGGTYCMLGRLDEALAYLTDALAMLREAGNRVHEVDALRTIASVHLEAGRHAEAVEYAEATLDRARELGVRRFEIDAVNILAWVDLARGDLDRAREREEYALRLARADGDRFEEVECLLGLALCALRAGDPAGALAHAEEALRTSRQCGFRLLEGRVLSCLAEVHLAAGRYTDGVRDGERALAIHRETGYRVGEEQAAALLARLPA